MMPLSMDIAGTLPASPASSQERYRKSLCIMHKEKKMLYLVMLVLSPVKRKVYYSLFMLA